MYQFFWVKKQYKLIKKKTNGNYQFKPFNLILFAGGKMGRLADMLNYRFFCF
ncbi:hypothetical protein [Agriterribacter humi]|uniref:hypothetical protein n=1 Tax=Agriterribacter humi TaxID=1104781 RepID=UPI00186AC3EC|nr:hypothetical protein [Agriterribacter humi]